MREQRLSGSRSAETLHADECAACSEPTIPPELDGGLDADTRCRTENRILVFSRGVFEELPTGHRDHRSADAVLRQRLARAHRERHLRAGGKQGDLTCA